LGFSFIRKWFIILPINFPYNADVIVVWTNEIGLLQISNRYYFTSIDEGQEKSNPEKVA